MGFYDNTFLIFNIINDPNLKVILTLLVGEFMLFEYVRTCLTYARDHPYIISANRLGGWGQKNGNFADVQYYLHMLT